MAEKFKTEITADHRLLDLHIRETFQYRDLITLFVKRDFTAQYKQTILGPVWAIFQPLFSTIVFVIVFGRLANLTTADIPGEFQLPSFLFYLSGNICWSYFSTTFSATTRVFIDNRSTMGKVYYPRLASPISIALSKLIAFGIQFALFMLIWLFYVIRGGTSIRITGWLFLVPVVVLQMIVLSIGLGITISAITTRYRDLLMTIPFILELWRYFCPIAYGLRLIPEQYYWLYFLNPVTPIITTFRYAVFGFGYFNPWYYLTGWLITIIILLTGLICFSKTERNFMDII
jgi:lipopolysaccharide transport system permease protein